MLAISAQLDPPPTVCPFIMGSAAPPDHTSGPPTCLCMARPSLCPDLTLGCGVDWGGQGIYLPVWVGKCGKVATTTSGGSFGPVSEPAHIHSLWVESSLLQSVCLSEFPSRRGGFSCLCRIPGMGWQNCGWSHLLPRVKVHPCGPYLPFRSLPGMQVPTWCLFFFFCILACFPNVATGKESTCRRLKEMWVWYLVRKTQWRRAWQPTPCLENPVDRGDLWAAVHRVAKSWTWLKRLSTHSTLLHGAIYCSFGCLYWSPAASFQLVFTENCSACRCIFDVFWGGGELSVLLFHHLDPLGCWLVEALVSFSIKWGPCAYLINFLRIKRNTVHEALNTV